MSTPRPPQPTPGGLVQLYPTPTPQEVSTRKLPVLDKTEARVIGSEADIGY